MRGYFLFGLSYGVASLSCTLPIFLAVIGSSFAASSIATSFAQFVLYALGMGVVIITLTLSMALFRGAMLGGMRKVMPYVHPIGTWLMIIRGYVHSVLLADAWGPAGVGSEKFLVIGVQCSVVSGQLRLVSQLTTNDQRLVIQYVSGPADSCRILTALTTSV